MIKQFCIGCIWRYITPYIYIYSKKGNKKKSSLHIYSISRFTLIYSLKPMLLQCANQADAGLRVVHFLPAHVARTGQSNAICQCLGLFVWEEEMAKCKRKRAVRLKKEFQANNRPVLTWSTIAWSLRSVSSTFAEEPLSVICRIGDSGAPDSSRPGIWMRYKGMRRYIKQVCIIQRERECMRVCGERKRSLATFIWHRTHHAQHTLLTAVVRYLILFCKPLSNPECIPRIRVRSQLRYHSNQFIHMTTYRDSRYPLSLFSIHCRFSGMKREDLPGLFSSRFKARFAAMARRGGKDAE